MNKKFLPILLVIAIGIIVVCSFYFSKYKKDNQTTNQPQNLEKITIANNGEYSIFHLIAKEKGYFAENGLDANIIEYPAGPPGITDLLAGKVDVAVASDFAGVRTIFTNKNLRIVATASKQKVFDVIALKSKGIANIPDLKGKKIGVTRKGGGEFFLGKFLTLNNLTLKDIIMVDLSPTEISEQLKKGQIDAAVIFDPHSYNLQKDLEGKVVVWSAQGNQNVYTTLYSTQDFIEKHPDLITKYMRAVLQAEDFSKSNEADAKRILEDKMHYNSKYVNYIWPKFDWGHTLDQALLLSMEDQARFVIENKITDQTKIPNYMEYIYFKALEDTAPERISIIR